MSHGPQLQRCLNPFAGAALITLLGCGLFMLAQPELAVRRVENLNHDDTNLGFNCFLVGGCLAWLSCVVSTAFRRLGLIPPAVALLMTLGILAREGVVHQRWPIAISQGLWIFIVLTAWFGLRAGFDRQRPGRSQLLRIDLLLAGLLLGLIYLQLVIIDASMTLPFVFRWRLNQYQLWLYGGFLLVFTAVRLFRPFFELCVEICVRWRYRLRGDGPGLDKLPTAGPVLVIANHACWWDPLFLAGVIPRPITPMMTSAFYDKWFLRPLMVHVFGTIRVADAAVRREAPELAEAIAALDAGRCVVIFPEAYLRRKEDVPLRRFGRGVFEILKARPNTPVVACWIEGSWGSYTSYFNGPPTKNKPALGRRSIVVGMAAPAVIPPQLFDHHLRTRLHLMNMVSQARAFIGLEPLPPFEWNANANSADANDSSIGSDSESGA